MKYFLIAGEASGDIHAAQMINALKELDAQADFQFLGGDLMAAASGKAPLIHYRDMAFMGFIEVIKHLRQILGFMDKAKAAIKDMRPDALILIDYPSFNLKVAKYAHSTGVPAFYYISPKVWAWKEYRVKQIKKLITEMYSILPFETAFYAKHDYRVEYVGNPTVNEIAEAKKNFASVEDFKKINGLDPEKKIIALIPGSRKKEIRDNLPEMVKAARHFPSYQIVIGGAPGIDASYYGKVLGGDELKVIFGKSFELVNHSRAALVTSGTATLETAIIGTPQIVCYRMNGSKLTYSFYSRLLKVKYVSLPNLIADALVVQELLLHYCNEERMVKELGPLLEDSKERQDMLDGYAEIWRRLTNADSAKTAARRLINRLNDKK